MSDLTNDEALLTLGICAGVVTIIFTNKTIKEFYSILFNFKRKRSNSSTSTTTAATIRKRSISTTEKGRKLEERVDNVLKSLGKWNVKRNVRLKDAQGLLCIIHIIH